MCGRYSLTGDLSELRERIPFLSRIEERHLRYNIAPRQNVPVLITESGQPVLKRMRWGLVPAWSKDESGKQWINARIESLHQKPIFKRLADRRRCLVPANGFYEWQKRPGGKTPFYITSNTGALFCFAGLWDRWRPRPQPEESEPQLFPERQAAPGKTETLETFTIITAEANAAVRPLHDRMPLILRPSDYTAWLDEKCGAEDAFSNVQAVAADELRCHPVSSVVNSPAYDGPECIRPVEALQPRRAPQETPPLL